MVDRILAADSADVFPHLFLVDLHVVAPGADHGEVGSVDRIHAIIAAARELEFELVGQRRTMHFVQKLVDDRAMRLHFVVAGHFATGMADAAHRGAQRGAGAAEVETDFVEVVEGLLHVLGRAALEHDVAGLAMEGDQARAVLLPDVAHLPQQISRIMVARRRLHTKRVEFFRGRILARDLGKARNDAAAVSEHRDGAALPVSGLRLVGMLELAEQVVHHRRILLVAGIAQPLQAGHEARPRTAFEFVEQRRRMLALRRRRAFRLIVRHDCAPFSVAHGRTSRRAPPKPRRRSRSA